MGTLLWGGVRDVWAYMELTQDSARINNFYNFGNKNLYTFSQLEMLCNKIHLRINTFIRLIKGFLIPEFLAQHSKLLFFIMRVLSWNCRGM